MPLANIASVASPPKRVLHWVGVDTNKQVGSVPYSETGIGMTAARAGKTYAIGPATMKKGTHFPELKR